MYNRSPEEEKAFVDLLVSHQGMISAYIISLLPGASETEDVIQNTNEVLWSKRDTFELGTNFKAWALTTARFQAMSYQSKLRSMKQTPLDDDVMNIVAAALDDMESQSMSDQLSDLNQCIGLLQIKDQELVLHRYWKKSGLADYSKATGRSISSLKSALFRVRTSLRDCMERKEQLREELA
ncbi:sigma-70 family RNA polymerase sigma factor [Verrucomicrobiaceae bacterium N1E253]|uniref:Sigma-70 family RNA polymerase sigma factor n=1 Tax=Oceaniferula marina TaxID=2748318 RepID=A0A851GAP2_9BACT|nr:sigma-70 family RNA polymerase sigma factor [Oceaniferula marina]NWK54476.1 sigma-70 family RNA polymerase sigma factor [Oceaniferula marina]